MIDQGTNQPSCYACLDAKGNQVDCPDNWSVSTSKTESCTFGHHCFTVQKTFSDKVTYQRGCQKMDTYKDYQEGCIQTKQGEICYKSCTTKNCNSHKNLPVVDSDDHASDASVASAVSAFALLYSLL